MMDKSTITVVRILNIKKIFAYCYHSGNVFSLGHTQNDHFSNIYCISQFLAAAWKTKNKIECVGACQAESPKCNSVFFNQQTLFCGLASLLGSYNTGITLIGNLAYVQVGICINL
jgi:hypothetical protein